MTASRKTDYYELLEIHAKATPEEISSAFQRMLRLRQAGRCGLLIAIGDSRNSSKCSKEMSAARSLT